MKVNKQKAYVEIRPAAGGDEAKIWATDLLRMYLKYATNKGWTAKPIDDYTLQVVGEGAFDELKNETGVHRVQRVPETEKRGRIHTSTATVAVLPEIKSSQVDINPNDLEWQFFRASTQGGQNVQKVSSAVRLIHKPTGETVTSQQERTQEQNRNIALELLRSRLWERNQEETKEKAQDYRSAIGRGKRSEKIRTYNFPRNQVKDHRVGKSWGKLDSIMDGDLKKVIKKTKGLS
mgnify:CR=1 FL=1